MCLRMELNLVLWENSWLGRDLYVSKSLDSSNINLGKQIYSLCIL